jgi:large subunit ribosomal protein L17
MRHRKAGRKLHRKSDHRKALYANLVTSLIAHGRIETTEAKAKEIRGLADRTINLAVKVTDLYAKGLDKLAPADRAKVVNANRRARLVVKDADALSKLFSEVGPQMKGRPGGYTRVLKTRNRRGDAAPMAFIELVAQA